VLAPLKAVKRAQSTPGSARPVSPPPSGYEEGGRHQGKDTGAPKPQGPEETAPAPEAASPPEDADLGGAARPAHAEEGRAIVASSAAPEAPTAGREEDAGWGKSPVIWPQPRRCRGGSQIRSGRPVGELPLAGSGIMWACQRPGHQPSFSARGPGHVQFGPGKVFTHVVK